MHKGAVEDAGRRYRLIRGVTMHSQRSLARRALVGGLGILVLASIWVLSATSASTQGEGESIFRQTCAVCHTVGRGALVGPDLQGVTERRQEPWLKVQIQSPSVHRAQKDPIAATNLEKFGIPMPDLGLTNQQVEAIIAYLKTAQSAPVAVPAQYVPTLALGVLAIVGFTVVGLIVGTKRVEVRP